MNDKIPIAKLEKGVLECLEACREGETPFLHLSEFIERLKADPEWSDAEIIELQTRVIRALLYRNPSTGDTAHD